MIVKFKPSALGQTRWYEYLVRFVLGGAMTVVAGLIAARFGPVIGGLFLAFPAIFPASATLIEKHVRERKEKAGLPGVPARQGSRGAGCRRSGAWEFRAGGFRPRDLADDCAVSLLGPHPRCDFVVCRRGARMAGAAMAVEGFSSVTDRSVHLYVDIQRIFSAEGPRPTPWGTRSRRSRQPSRIAIPTELISPAPFRPRPRAALLHALACRDPRAPRSPAAGLDAALGRPLSSFPNKT